MQKAPRPTLHGWYVGLPAPARAYLTNPVSDLEPLDAAAALAQAQVYTFDADGLSPLVARLAKGPAPYRQLGLAFQAEDAIRRGHLERGRALFQALANAPGPLRAWAGLRRADTLEREGAIDAAESLLRAPTWTRADEPPLLRSLVEGRLLFRRGELAAAAATLEAASPQCAAAPKPVLGAYQRTLAIYLTLRGDHAHALLQHRAALQTFRELGDVFMVAKEYLSLGQSYEESDELDHAEFFLRKAAETVEQFDNAPLTALLAARLGMLALVRGELPTARRHFEHDLEASLKAGTRHGQGFARRNLGKVLVRLGEAERGQALIARSLEDFAAQHDDFNVALSRLEAASAKLASGDAGDRAAITSALDEVDRYFRRVDRLELLPSIEAVRARLHVAEGKEALAADELDAAGRALLARRRPERLIEELLLFAEACLRQGSRQRAVWHLSWAYRESVSAARPWLSSLVLERLGEIDERAVMDIAAAARPPAPAQPDERFQRFLMASRSPRMRAVIDDARRVAPTDETVLIEGETGTGKSVLASFIHAISRRAQAPFMALNCGAIPEALFEAELFGHEKGAFTGADARRVGIIEAANGGVVFLDEVGELTPRGQVTLLRFLEDHHVRPVGSSTSRPVDVRVIAATNRVLVEEMKAGRFRQDLYFRLAVYPLRVPPLRERWEELPDLVAFLLAHNPYAQQKGIVAVSKGALRKLARHDWPGNLRELDNTLRGATIRANGNHILERDLPAELDDRRLTVAAFPTLEQMTERHIKDALRLAHGNRSRAASLLGVHRNTLGARLRAAPDGLG